MQKAPSEAERSAKRGSPTASIGDLTAAEIRQQLRGDLDNIVLMALRKEPTQRYASVEQFATDIQRHLDNLPVIACRDTLRYRASKFMRRHRGVVVAAVAIALTLLVGLGATLYEARRAREQQLRAEKRFQDVRKLANSLMFEIHDSIRDLPGSTNARKLLVERALQYLDSLSTESANDPSLQRELGFAYERVGDVQGYFYNANLGDTSAALQSYRKALAIREVLAKSNPKDRTAQSDLASSYTKLADALYSRGDKAGALEQTRHVLAIRNVLAQQDSSETTQHMLADGHRLVGDALIDMGDWAGAKEEYQQAVAGFEQVVQAYPQSLRSRRMAGIMHDKIGFVDERLGDISGADREYSLGLEILEKLAKANPTSVLLQRNLALAYLDQADIAIGRRDPRGMDELKKAAAIVDGITSADASNLRILRDVNLIYAHLGDAEKKNGHPEAALRYYTHALEAAKKRAAGDPQDMDAAEGVANRYESLGQLYLNIAQHSPRKKRVSTQNARMYLQKSLAMWTDPKRPAPLSAQEKEVVEEIQHMLRECDALEKRTTVAE